jgi:DNA-directed RNA polymerase specialized sigma24 family protein
MKENDLEELRKGIRDWLAHRGHFAYTHADDIAQETLIIYWQDSLTREQPLTDPLRWCKKVAWRLMINKHRGESKVTLFSEIAENGDSWIDARFQDTMEPERDYIAKETLTRARAHIHPKEIEEEDRPRTAMERWRLQQFRLEEKGLPYAPKYRSGLTDAAGQGLQTEAEEISCTSQEPLETDS